MAKETCFIGLFALLVAAPVVATEVDLTGRWEGAIELPGVELGLVLHLRVGEDGEWAGTVDIPMQGASGLPVAGIVVEGGELGFSLYLARLAGRFELAGQVLAVDVRDDGTLTLTVPGQPTYELDPERGTRFSIRGLSGFAVRFELDEAGRARELILLQPNGVFRAARRE